MSDKSPDSSVQGGVPQIDPNQALREKLAFYEEQFPGFFFRQRADWSFQHIDPRVRTGLDLEPVQCLRHGEHFFSRIHPKDRAPYWDGLLRFAEGEDTRSQRFRIVDKEGRVIRHVLEVRQPLRLQSGLLLGYNGVWFDMSAQAQLEAQVTFQAWQQSLGDVTRILLHDFRNAMTGLQTLLELYSGQLDADHSWKEGFRLMLDTTLRTQTTVERLSHLVRDEPKDDVIFSLHQFVENELGFWNSLWSRPVRIVGAKSLPNDFMLEADATTLRRFWLQYLLLHKPMEEEIDELHFDWKPVKEGEWIIGDAFPFGLRASSAGLHLSLSPSPSPFLEGEPVPGNSREWPDARWRQIQEFADTLKLQIAYSQETEDAQHGTLHIFWPSASVASPAIDESRTSPGTPVFLPTATVDSMDVIILGDWETESIRKTLREAGYNPITTLKPPMEPIHGLIVLNVSLTKSWKEWIKGDICPRRLIYVHPIDAEPPADLPDSFFTLPSRLPENQVLLELQLQELMR